MASHPTSNEGHSEAQRVFHLCFFTSAEILRTLDLTSAQCLRVKLRGVDTVCPMLSKNIVSPSPHTNKKTEIDRQRHPYHKRHKQKTKELDSGLLAATSRWSPTLLDPTSQTESRVSRTLVVCSSRLGTSTCLERLPPRNCCGRTDQRYRFKKSDTDTEQPQYLQQPRYLRKCTILSTRFSVHACDPPISNHWSHKRRTFPTNAPRC